MRRVAVVVLGVAAAGTALAAGNRRPSDAERGKELYERHCQSCHGPGARGDGPATADLVADVPDVPDLTADNIADQVELVLLGREAMPGFEASFDRYDARRVLRQMARLRAAPVPESTVDEPPPPGGEQRIKPVIDPPPSLQRKVEATDPPETPRSPE